MYSAVIVIVIAGIAFAVGRNDSPTTSNARDLVALARTKTGPDGKQATSGVSYVESDTPGVPARMRDRPHQTDGRIIDEVSERFPVIMKCWVSSQAPSGAPSAKWFLVAQTSGAPHSGVTGWIWSDLVWEQIQVPACSNGAAKAANPDFLKNARIGLAKGAATTDGYYIDIRVEGVPAGWRVDLDCQSVVYGQRKIVRSVQLVADGSGNTRSSNDCSGYATQFGETHWVTMPWPRLGRTESHALESTVTFKAEVPAGPAPAISNFAVTVRGPGTAQVSFNVSWTAGRDPVTCAYYIDAREVFSAQCGTAASRQFSGLAPGKHTFHATVTDRYGVVGFPSPVLTRTITGDPPPTQSPPRPTTAPPPPKPTIANFTVVVYTSEPGHVGVAYDVGWQSGRDPVICHFFMDGQEVFTAQCGTHSSKQFYGISPGQHSFYATVSDRYGIYSDPSPTIVKTVPGQAPPAPGPAASLAKGPAAPSGFRYAITIDHFAPNAGITITCHDSVDPQGFYTFTLHTDANGHAFTQSYCYSGDHPDHWYKANGIESNHVTW